MNISERLKALRLSRRLTQEELCREILVSQRSYSDYEKGRVNIPVSALVRIALFYDISLLYLCGVTEQPDRFEGERDLMRYL